MPDLADETCAVNPVFSTFSPDRKRVTFAWEKPVASYTGAMITSFGGKVVAVGPDSVTMLRNDETRLGPDGRKVLWIMRFVPNPEGYCWTRADWTDGQCLPQVRCGAQPNS